MQSKELISVIIPVYNGASYLSRCLNSVLSQTYKEFEIVIVDDGSEDGTDRILKKYADVFEKVKVFHTKHKGVSHARNYGIDMAQGSYIAFVDADDEIAPQYLDVLYHIIKEKDAEIAVCGLAHVHTKQACVPRLKKSMDQFAIDTITVTDGRQFLERMEEPLRYEITTVCWNKLYKKEVFYDKKYPDGRIYEDSAMMHELLYPIKRMAEIDEKLYLYHTETIGITRSDYRPAKLDEVIFAKRRMQFFYRKKEKKLYILARKQYCIALLKHFYLLKQFGIKTDSILSKLQREMRRYLKGYRWKRTLPFPVRAVFELGVYLPTVCGAFLVAWDWWLERNERTYKSE